MSIKIRFATDFVCPYCIAAKTTLMQAIGDRDDVEIETLPVELSMPDTPPVDTYNDPVRRAKYAKELIPFCEELGLKVHMPPNVVPRPYTHLAWQGFYFAEEQGLAEEYVAAMYNAYFCDEKDIGDIDVLTGLAEGIGLNGTFYRTILESGIYSKKVLSKVAKTRAMGVKGVPTIWINDIRLSDDLYTKEAFEHYIHLAEQGESAVVEGSGPSCGPNGC